MTWWKIFSVMLTIFGRKWIFSGSSVVFDRPASCYDVCRPMLTGAAVRALFRDNYSVAPDVVTGAGELRSLPGLFGPPCTVARDVYAGLLERN